MNNKELKSVNEQLEAKVAALEAKIAELSAISAKPISKGKTQAEQAFALLKQGPVNMEQLRTINEKYPNDPIYFVRTILKVDVKTTRVKGGKTTYSLKAAEVVAAPPASEEAPSTETTEPAAEVTKQEETGTDAQSAE